MATNLGVAEGYLELDFSELKRACTGAVQELHRIGQEGDRAQTDLRKLETVSTGTAREMSNLSTRIQTTRTNLLNFGTAAQEAGEKWKAAGEKISRVGNELTTKITAPLLAAGTASVKMAMDAESSFAKVSTIADETVLSYDKMKKEVVAASNESGIERVETHA